MKGNEDLDELLRRLRALEDEIFMSRIEKLKVYLSEGKIKRNHTFMEITLASDLHKRGFEVYVEHDLGNGLVCDILAIKGGRREIIEIETGFVPPSDSSRPTLYRKARETAKIVRYSPFSDVFALATPPYHLLYIDPYFYDDRSEERANMLKEVVNLYYKNPPVELSDIKAAHIEKVYIIDVDQAKVFELSVGEYLERRGNFIDQATPLTPELVGNFVKTF